MSTAHDLARSLAAHAEDFCRRYLPNGRRVGNYWMVGNIHGDTGRSLAVRLKASGGRAAGKWSDHALGIHGDLLDILQANVTPDDWRSIADEARSFLGSAPPVSTPPLPSNRRSRPAGQRLFALGRPIADTPASRYLSNRGITRIGPALHYHHAVYFLDSSSRRQQLPALLAAITDNAGTVTGCARTWLDAKTASLADIDAPKRVIGALFGNAVRFAGAPHDPDLFAGEGVETILSVGSALQSASLAACLTANHLAVFEPPDYVRRLLVAHDNDDAGRYALAQLTCRLVPRGIDVLPVPPRRNDFNDDLRADGVGGLRETLSHCLDQATIERLIGA
ncbi:MAG: toprim domain-containing protein [Rhizobiaceae bacterium]|nr:toprim domain-containing protein [Rhizobiaceae bacterium]